MSQEKTQKIFHTSYDQSEWKKFLGEIFPKAALRKKPEILPGIDSHVATEAKDLGYITLDENGIERQIAVYEVTLADGIILERNRVGLRNLLRKYWKDIDAAFIAYYLPGSGKWRFTYVSELTGYDAEGEFVQIKTEPKRYTYLLGEGESVRTAEERFDRIRQKGGQATLEDVKEAFSVEKLSKMFFDRYKEHYDAFCQYMISQPGICQTIFNGDEKAIRDFNKKLLGRIVFLYFIQKKGWLGVPKNENTWGKGDFNFLTKHFQDFQNKELFYQDFLSVLFFDTLNNKRAGDLIALGGGEPCRIPYLNGGLFEEENKNHRNLIFQPELFKNLFNFFDQYNFTIYEDDPNDHTVAVDPEMLGHIFENLLEDNKDKGAYYTPKEIVHYMCQESLIEYLTTWFEKQGYQVVYRNISNPQQPELFSLNEVTEGQLQLEIPVEVDFQQIDRILIEKLLKKNLDEKDELLIKKHSEEFHRALDSVKICDPAIGSGAFPMGLLHEIFTAKQTLHIFQFGNTTNFDASGVKLNIIQNSIYGVDIERGAVDIARLRFWLSLIVDEPEPKALPNLDYKIVVGNSLVSKLDDQIIDIDWDMGAGQQGNVFVDVFKPGEILKKISQAQQEFFTPDSNKKSLAKEIRLLKIDLLISQLELMVKTKGLETAPTGKGKGVTKQTEIHLQTVDWKNTISQLKKLKKQSELPLNFFDWKLDFPEVMNEQVAKNTGFDIVIGNPPYIQLQKEGGKLADMFTNQGFTTFERTGDIYTIFYEQGIQLAKIEGVLMYITSNKWMRAGYGKSTRAFFSKHNPLKIIDLGAGVFETATVDTNILLIQKTEKPVNNFKLKALDISKVKNINSFEEFDQQWVTLDKLSDQTWTILNPTQNNIKQKIERIGKPLKDWDVQINYGIKTGLNEAFIIDNLTKELLCQEYPKSAEIIKPVLRGRDIKRYQAEWAGLWLIFIPWHFPLHKDDTISGYSAKAEKEFSKQYPVIYNHLLKLKDKLSARNKAETGIRYEWYALQRCAATYYPEFDKEKIIWQEIAQESCFIYDNSSYYINDTSRMLTGKNIKFLLAIFNTKLFTYIFSKYFAGGGLGEKGIRFKSEFMKDYPIPNLSEQSQKPFIKIVDKILTLKSEGKDTTTLEQQIDNLVYKLYELTYEEVKIIDPEFALTEKEYESIRE